MKIRIIQTITNTLDQDRKVLKTVEHEAFRVAPDAGKILRNKITGDCFESTITVSPEAELKNYEEIDKKVEEEDF